MRSGITVNRSIRNALEAQRLREIFGTDWIPPGLEMTPLARAFDWHPSEPKKRILLPCDVNGKNNV